MKIVFLNVWGDEMQDALIPFLIEQAKTTDIFCFQEATEMVQQRCAAALVDYDGFHDYKYIDADDYFPISTYVRKHLSVLSSGTLMSDRDDQGLSLYVTIETPTGRMLIGNVHGKSRPGDKLDNPGRIAQSQTLIDFFKTKTDPVIIGGDFNVQRETRSIGLFAENGYRDLISEYDIKTTRNHLAWDRFPHKMLYSDYVFVGNTVTVQRFAVPDNEVSDHLPLILEVDLDHVS